MNRRQFIRYVTGLAAAGLISVAVGDLLLGNAGKGSSSSTTTSSTTSSPRTSIPDYQEFLNWLGPVSRPYAGTTLNMSLEEEFTPLTLQLIDGDFASATGISDQYSIKPYSLQLSDVSLMFETQSPTYDVFGLDNQNLGAFPNDSLSPVDLAQRYPDLTYPNFDFQDFDPFMWNYVGNYPPLVSGGPPSSTVPVLPLDTPLMVMYYRTDVYEKLGLSLPVTWDDYYSNIQAIAKSKLTPFAAVSQAAPDISIVYEFLNHLASFGGTLWSVDGSVLTPNLTDDKVLAALENYVRLAPYSDTGSSTYTWDNVFDSLSRGVSATGLLWNGYSNWVNDIQRSAAAGDFAYARNPAGPSGSFSTFGGAGVGVSKFSKNPQAAWLWLQWATAKGTQEAMVFEKYHVYPTRDSAAVAPGVAASLAEPSFAIANLSKQIWQSHGTTALIGFPKWFYALSSLSYHLNQAWLNVETPTQALNSAQSAIEALGQLTF